MYKSLHRIFKSDAIFKFWLKPIIMHIIIRQLKQTAIDKRQELTINN